MSSMAPVSTEERYLASRFTPCTVLLYTHTHKQTSNQVSDKVFEDKDLNSRPIKCRLRMHFAGWGSTVILLFIPIINIYSCVQYFFFIIKTLNLEFKNCRCVFCGIFYFLTYEEGDILSWPPTTAS